MNYRIVTMFAVLRALSHCTCICLFRL